MNQCLLCGKKKLSGGIEEDGKFFCSRQCAAGFKVIKKGFCEKCIAETTEQSVGGGTRFNGIGTALGVPYRKSKCPECNSVIQQKWFYLLFPLLPRGKFRIIMVRDKQKLGEQTHFFLSRRLKVQRKADKGYLRKTLQPDEKLLFSERIRGPKIFLPILLIISGAIVSSMNSADFIQAISVILALLGVLYFFYSVINKAVSVVGLTDKRVLIKVGIIIRKRLDAKLQDIKTVAPVSLTALASGYGTLVVTPVQGVALRVPGVENLLGFEELFNELTGKSSEKLNGKG